MWDHLRRIEDRIAVSTARVLGSSRAFAAGRPSLGILCYHRISDSDRDPTWNVTPRQFEQQMRGLLAAGFVPLRLEQLLSPELHREPSLRGFAVTFDDGYLGIATHAAPLLAELGIPATLFLATAYVGSGEPFPFDDWDFAGSSGVSAADWCPLDWDEVARLCTSGTMEIGTHTHTHRDFRQDPSAFRQDLLASRDAVRERLGVSCRDMAYPYGTVHRGYCGSPLGRIVKELEFRCALSLAPGGIAGNPDPLTWGRILVTQRDTAATLEVKLGGWYGPVRETMRRATEPLRPGIPSKYPLEK